MELQEYYNIITERYSSGDFTLKKGKHLDLNPEINENEFPLHALNYLIFEYMKDNKDNRWKLLLDYILVPNGMNQKDCDIDFTKVNFEEFFYFMLNIKN